jgi:hypothetical protein
MAVAALEFQNAGYLAHHPKTSKKAETAPESVGRISEA